MGRFRCRVVEYNLPRIKHTETLRRLVIAGLNDEFSVRLPKVRLPRYTGQWRQVAKALRVKQDGCVSGRRITTDPVFRTPVVFLPCCRDR